MSYIPGLVQEPDFIASTTGFVNGHAAISIALLGRRSLGWGSTSVPGGVSNYLDTSQNVNNNVLLGTDYYLRSSSASDTAAGIGAQSMRIVYLDSGGLLQTMTVAMNGTTGVLIGNGISYIESMELASVGANLNTVGSISISTVVGAPTTAQIVEYIQAASTHSRSGRYKIPVGRIGYLHSWDVTALGNNQDVAVRATIFTDSHEISTVFNSIDNLFVTGGSGHTSMSLHWVKIPAGAEIRISSIPTAAAAANRLDITLNLLLLTD